MERIAHNAASGNTSVFPRAAEDPTFGRIVPQCLPQDLPEVYSESTSWGEELLVPLQVVGARCFFWQID